MSYSKSKIYVVIAIFGLILSFSACNKSKDPGPAVVKFNLSEDTYNEDEGTAEIQVDLSSKQSKDVTIDFNWSGSATTYLNGDFGLTSGSITIPAGEKTGHITIDIIDDTQLDGDDVISLTLIDTDGNTKLSTASADLHFDLTLADNDELPGNVLQADLTWSTGDGEDVDLGDLDLYVQYDVTYEDGIFTNNGTTLTGSDNPLGFESVLIGPNDPNTLYAFLVPYFEGTADVDFTLTLNGFGWANASVGDSFAASDAGNGSFFMIGPFVKDGTSFVSQTGGGGSSGRMGKTLKIKGSDLKQLKKKK